MAQLPPTMQEWLEQPLNVSNLSAIASQYLVHSGINVTPAVPAQPTNMWEITNPQIIFDDIQQDEEPSFNHMAGALVPPTMKRREVSIGTNPNQKRLMQELVHYGNLKLEKTKCRDYESKLKLKAPKYNWCHPHALVGIEVEVENIKEAVYTPAYWTAKTDGSLRNNGVEFVSIPLQVKQIQPALELLYESLNMDNEPDFSNRTSIHIHLNCRDMTQDQLWNLVILYCLFEKHFYALSGSRRLGSIFCVPVFRTQILRSLNSFIYELNPCWHKYCGINLMPLLQNSQTGCYGTVEFRHLYGTPNMTTVMRWIDNILALRKMAMSIEKEELLHLIKEMNTTSSYKSMYVQIFGVDNQLLTKKADFEECISYVKQSLFGHEYGKTLQRTDRSVYWQLCSTLGVRG